MAQPDKVTELTATLVLLFEAARPSPDEFAAALVAAWPDETSWNTKGIAWLSLAVEEAAGYVDILSMDVGDVIHEAEDSQDSRYIGTRAQAVAAVKEASRHFDVDTHGIRYDAIKLLDEQGLFKSLTTEETEA